MGFVAIASLHKESTFSNIS